MTVQWISAPQEKESTVSYRPAKEKAEWLKTTGESYPFPQSPHYLIHRVEIKNLLPNSEYRFKVASSEKEFQFLTAPSQLTKELRFVVGGDMYHDAIHFMAKTCQRAAETSPLFALLGGDIAYAVTSLKDPVQNNERWVQWVKTWHTTMTTPQGNMIPVIAAIGNHDLIGQYGQTPAQASVFAHLFPMPGKRIYNVLDFNSYLTILLLDSGHANPINGEQAKWLDATLEARQQIPHRLAAYHVPAYPSARSFQNKHSLLVRTYWVPLFEKWKLQTAFEHHDHAYKRTHPLLKNRAHPEGVVYLGDGGWGVEKPRKLHSKKHYLAKFACCRHFIAVAITPSHQQFKCINDQGQIIDEWTHPINSKKKEEQKKFFQLPLF